jgi:hypothetical protein
MVRRLLETGATGAAIARELGISKSTVSYHKRRLGHAIDTRCNRPYDWELVQRFYDVGHSITECQEQFGFARKTFMDAASRGAITTRPPAAPIATYLVKGRPREPHASQGPAVGSGPQAELL